MAPAIFFQTLGVLMYATGWPILMERLWESYHSIMFLPKHAAFGRPF